MNREDNYPFYNQIDEEEEPEETLGPLTIDVTSPSHKEEDRVDTLSGADSYYQTPLESQYIQKNSESSHVDNPLEEPHNNYEEHNETAPLFSVGSNAKDSIHSNSNLSYSAYQKLQSALPNKWLREINVDPYLSRHPPASTGMKKSSTSGASPTGLLSKAFGSAWRRDSSPAVELQETRKESLDEHKRDQLLEGLLPQTNFDRANRNEYVAERMRRDVFFSVLFALSFTNMMIVGLVYVFQFPNVKI